ncbi:MAG: carboxypeptidase-like regulatory domain-containing protein, partial [Acidobacteria bacterium]|nr:carboxypeptidase-like regulatory domain-containing protein [Acidobacteriota bacterium]
MFNRKHVKINACFIALLSFIFLSATAFGQGTSANLSGTVQDASSGVLVGVNLTARNVDIGTEARAATNDRGVYNFASLPPGNYEVVAESAGFSRAVRTVRLGAGAQNTLNFTMTVAGTVTEVEVTGVTESVMLEASASTGNVFQEDIIQAVPMLSNNVMDTLNLMGGVTRITTGSTVWNADEQNVAGVSAAMINVTRDGISVTEVRNPTGISAASNINTEVVGEMRIVMSPVDAELGRGAGQIQITTRSGSNAFRGSAVWNVQNTALDAQEFEMKRSGLQPNWRNMNNYMITFGGPIIKNRTFFFINWEQQFGREKVNETARVLTPCARRGIYRYLSSPEGGWIPASINTNNAYSVYQGNMRSVESDGTPWKGGTTVLNSNDNNQPYNIGATTLHVESVFGQLTSAARSALLSNGPGSAYDDCSVLDNHGWNPQSGSFGTVAGTYWAPHVYRTPYDTTGFVNRFTNGVDYGSGTVVMPPANYFQTGDGLNTAGHLWVRRAIGNGSSIWGTGGDPDRKSVTARFDHNINNEHRLSGTFNYEHFNIDDAYQQWPSEFGGYGGTIDRIPYGFTATLTSTLRPTLLNEFRFGLSLSDTWTYAPLEANGDKMRSVLMALLPTDTLYPSSAWVNDKAVILGAGETDTAFRTESGGPNNGRHPYGSRGNIPATWGGKDPRWSISDTITWMKGAHSFKGGFEYRRQSSLQDYFGERSFGGGSLIDTPVVRGGLTGDADSRRRGSFTGFEAAHWDGVWAGSRDNSQTVSGNYSLPYQMMTFFSGSIGEMAQYFFMVPDAGSPTGARWNNVEAGETSYVYDIANQEFSAFFKDDWKVTNDLTLNLGVRYEYYGVPYAKDNKTMGVVGGSKTAWGLSTGGFDNWLRNRQYIATDRNAPAELFPGYWVAGDIIYPEPAAVYDFIGSGTRNPDRMAWNRDTNNFAPHVGFAWQLPWFGRGMTTLRGGYSVSYSQVNNFNMYGVWIADIATAATAYAQLYRGEGFTGTGPYESYMDITDLGDSRLLPIKPSTTWMPLAKRNFGDTYSTATIIDENLRNPYVHSLNMSLTRNIGRAVTVDIRYIGTLGRNQISTLNLNQSNYLDTGLHNELEIVRQGGQSAVLNSIIPADMGLWFGGSGSDQLRASNVPVPMGGGGATPATAEALAFGNFSGIAATLATTNGVLGMFDPNITSTTSSMLAKAGCLPQDRDPVSGVCLKG